MISNYYHIIRGLIYIYTYLRQQFVWRFLLRISQHGLIIILPSFNSLEYKSYRNQCLWVTTTDRQPETRQVVLISVKCLALRVINKQFKLQMIVTI